MRKGTVDVERERRGMQVENQEDSEPGQRVSSKRLTSDNWRFHLHGVLFRPSWPIPRGLSEVSPVNITDSTLPPYITERCLVALRTCLSLLDLSPDEKSATLVLRWCLWIPAVRTCVPACALRESGV